MISSFVRALVSAFKARRELALKNVALRQQLGVLPRSVKRLRLSNVDREFWVLLRVLPPLSVGGAAPTLVPRALHTPSMVSGRKVADLWPISKGPGFGTGRDSPAYLTGESAAASCLESSFAAS